MAVPRGTIAGADIKHIEVWIISEGMPGITGPEIDQLYKDAAAWLDGADSPGNPL